MLRRILRKLVRREVQKILVADEWETISREDVKLYHGYMMIELATKDPQTPKLDRLLGMTLATLRLLDD